MQIADLSTLDSWLSGEAFADVKWYGDIVVANASPLQILTATVVCRPSSDPFIRFHPLSWSSVGRIMRLAEHTSESQGGMAARDHAPIDAAELPEHALRISGAVRLVLVINLGSFVAPADADTFRHARGSEPFAAALRELRPQPPFLLDEATTAIERDAYALRIFRSRLLHNHFMPTYRVGWDATMRRHLANHGDDQRWQHWNAKVRLSRNGLVVITLEDTLENVSLVSCAERVLELPPRGQPAQPQDQWSLGMTILSAFLDSIDRQLTIGSGEQMRIVHFTEFANVRHTLRLDRFVIYMLRSVASHGALLSPDVLKREYAPTLASFMEGALVEYDGIRRFPRYAADQAQTLAASDVASWDEELCLFTGESALIYCPLLSHGLAYVGGPLRLDAHAYSAYWAGIARGIEFVVAYHAEVQQFERRTTDLLRQIPGLTRSVNDGNLSPSDIALIEHLAAGLSDIFDSLPEQRSVAVTANAFRADYVQRKFAVLFDKLDVRATLDLVNTNVEQLDFFLSYYNDMRLQWEGQKTNSLGVALGAIVLFMAVSSFLADTFSVIDRLTSPTQSERDIAIRNFGIALVAGLIAAVGLWLLAGRARRLFFRKRHF